MKRERAINIICLAITLSIAFTTFAETLYWNQERGYEPFRFATDNGIEISNPTDTTRYDYFRLPRPSEEFELKFRARNINGHPGKKYFYNETSGGKAKVINPFWGFFITCKEDTLIFTARGNETKDLPEPRPCIELNLYNKISCGQDQLSAKEVFTIADNINPYDGDNLWDISIRNGSLNLKAGDKGLSQVLSKNINSEITGFGFLAGWGDEVKISEIKCYYNPLEEDTSISVDRDSLNDYFSGNVEPLEGYWTIFDRELEESLIKLGGTYILVCVKKGEDYEFLYMEGANVNSQAWKPGDLKARLKPTHFSGIYNVEWIDSMKDLMDKEIQAQEGEGNTLLIQFPYQSSKIRLRKIP